MSRRSSRFNRGINDILELASNVLAETNQRIQDKIDEMEIMKGALDSNENIPLTSFGNDGKYEQNSSNLVNWKDLYS